MIIISVIIVILIAIGGVVLYQIQNVQNQQMSSIPFSSIYNALTDDDDELKKKKNAIGM